MKQVLNRRLVPLSSEELEALRSAHARCLVDVGTGDGRFVYRYAAEHPEALCVGLDPVADAMREISAKAARKPARGGLPNALFLMDAAETLPGGLAGFADLLTINYPWGSLLRALAAPEVEILKRLAALGHPGTELVILFNASVFDDPAYCARLGITPIEAKRARGELASSYAEAGLEVEEVTEHTGPVDHRTSWGQRLILGSARKTLRVAGRIYAI
jgi:16S rRNA (adenine(1408)-N(1))-methyltransferase